MPLARLTVVYANRVGLSQLRDDVRDTVHDAAGKLARTAADTRAAMVALAVLGVAALAVALAALAVGLKARMA
jgi:hypothetical protein